MNYQYDLHRNQKPSCALCHARITGAQNSQASAQTNFVLCAGRIFVCFCVRGGIGNRGGVSWLWGCFKPRGGLLCWPFWGGGPGVGLAFCCFVFYSTRQFALCLTLCYFVLVFFGPFSIAITSLGEERGNLGAFRTFVRFGLVWSCRFPLPLGVWEFGDFLNMVHQYVSLRFGQLRWGNTVATIFGKDCQLCLPSGFLWLLNCICLSFPFDVKNLKESDCISS